MIFHDLVFTDSMDHQRAEDMELRWLFSLSSFPLSPPLHFLPLPSLSHLSSPLPSSPVLFPPLPLLLSSTSSLLTRLPSAPLQGFPTGTVTPASSPTTTPPSPPPSPSSTWTRPSRAFWSPPRRPKASLQELCPSRPIQNPSYTSDKWLVSPSGESLQRVS